MKTLKIIICTMMLIIVGLGVAYTFDVEPVVEVIDSPNNLLTSDKQGDRDFDELKMFYFGQMIPAYDKHKLDIDDRISKIDEIQDLSELEGIFYLTPEEIGEDPILAVATKEAVLFSASYKFHLKNEGYVVAGKDFEPGAFLSYTPLTLFKIEDVVVTNIQHDLSDCYIFRMGSLVSFTDSYGRTYTGICIMPQGPAIDKHYTFYGFLNTIFNDGNTLTAGIMYAID